MEHHSLCSASGIPHSTQTRIRCFGGSFFPNRRFNSDMTPPGRSCVTNTLDGPAEFPVVKRPGYGVRVDIFFLSASLNRGRAPESTTLPIR
jgi:hypothetical protein